MSSFKISPAVRVAIYVLNLLGAPVVVYLRARNIIGDLELTLWGAEVSAMSLLAGVHVPAASDPAPDVAPAKKAAKRAPKPPAGLS